MEKSLQPSCKLSKFSRSTDVYSADRISELPNEVLESILSRLTMREAVRTSMLSRRWKHLWAYTTGSLDFDFGSAALTAMKETKVFDFLEMYRASYIMWVNKFLNSHKGPSIESFRVAFDFQSSDGPDINSWIKFALRKRVQRLELDLGRVGIKNREENWPFSLIEIKDCYRFPALEESLLDNNNNNKSSNIISCLTSLDFNFVDMTGESVEYLLSNCPFLEYVRILNSPSLVGARVVATCPKLKHLEIAHCHHLEFLDFSSAPNLTSLSYSGPKETRLCFRNVPNLADVSLGGEYCVDIVEKFHELPLALSQIEKLKLSPCTEVFPYFRKFPELKNVTQLELKFKAVRDDHSLRSCAYAIEVCPSLYRLLVQFNWVREPKQRERLELTKRRSHHKCLKVVELGGFRGGKTDVELATYIFSKAPFLEKITVDTRNPSLSVDKNLYAKKVARLLATQLSLAAEVLIL